MGLLAHQQQIVSAVEDNFITSVSAPRCNGKTYTALWVTAVMPGVKLYIAPGFRAARAAYEDALRIAPDPIATSKKELSITRDNGTTHFLVPGRGAGRGLRADVLIFDDADTMNDDVSAQFYPAIAAADNPRIVAFSVLNDEGLARHFAEKADVKLHWRDKDAKKANPALGSLITEKALARAEQVLTREAYRREHLGLSQEPLTVHVV